MTSSYQEKTVDTTDTIASITAHKLKTGWRYEQAGVVVRTSKKAGAPYAFAVLTNGAASSFCGTLKTAEAELRLRQRHQAEYAAKIAGGIDAECARIAHEWRNTKTTQKEITECAASGMKNYADYAAHVFAIAPITVVEG